MINEFTEKVIHIIKSIPRGKILTYGSIAALAGKPGGARQVSWVLHSSSRKYKLPWHRVINSSGKISLKHPLDYQHQKNLLVSEGIEFSLKDVIDLKDYLWDINSIKPS